MKTVIDTHLHYYAYFDAEAFINSLSVNLDRIAPGCRKAGIVLDRWNKPGFKPLVEALSGKGKETRGDDGACLVCSTRLGEVRVYQGVQVACSERFEVLGLFCGTAIPDGVPASEAVSAVLAQGGIPVIAWAPGKWMFRRRGLVSKLLSDADTGNLLVGDTALRPALWPEPALMKSFRNRGGRVVCGSDPLPFKGQESCAGVYATLISNGPDDVPLRSLLCCDSALYACGNRTRPHVFVRNILRLSLCLMGLWLTILPYMLGGVFEASFFCISI